MNKMFSDELLKFKLPALLSPGKPSVWQADKSAACKKHQNYNSLGAAAEFIKALKPDFSMDFGMRHCFLGLRQGKNQTKTSNAPKRSAHPQTPIVRTSAQFAGPSCT